MLKRLVKLQLFPDSYIKNFVAVSLLLTAAFLILFNSLYYSFAIEERKAHFLENRKEQAHVLASHLATPLAFGKSERAEELINEQLSYKNTVGLYVYNASGVLLCGYYKGQESTAVPALQQNEYRIESPIYYENFPVGTLVSIVTSSPVHKHFLHLFTQSIYANIAASIMVVLMVIFFIVRTLLRPLRALSKTARRVREEQTYSLRAERNGMGELAELTDSFNSMLDHIESHDMFLLSESRDLEKQVQERTEELEKATEEAKAANTAKSEFLASVSHELRTPLNAILGMTDMLQTTDLTSKQWEYAEIIASASQNLLHLINGVLDLSKLEAKKLEIEEANFILRDVLDELTIIFTEKVAVKEMDLIVVVDENVPPVIHGDAFRLKQILLNLVGNAFKFADRGAIELHVSLERVVRSSHRTHLSGHEEVVHLVFSVADKGIGIAEEAQQKLFETFVQADGSTSRQYGGTGLGLSIVAELVSLMKGTVSVESTVGEGSKFLVVLPFAVAEGSRNMMLPVFSGWRVLVLEPSVAARVMWRTLFSELGMLVVVLGSEQQALLQLERQAQGSGFDLVVLGSKEKQDMQGRLVQYLCDHPEQKVMMAARLGDEALPEGTCQFTLTSFLRRPITFSQVKLTILRTLDSDRKVRSELDIEARSVEGLSVLTVEDNQINQQVMREILEYLGVKVTIAKDGLTALELLSVYKYDVVLMDIQLPGMDGFTTTTRLREELDLKDLPVIAMTAHTLQEDKDRAELAGMNGYLTKPVELDELVRVLKKYDKRKRQAGTAVMPDDSGQESAQHPLGETSSQLQHKEQPQLIATQEELLLPALLPGLAVAEGVERLNGKSHIYLIVVRTFIDTYANVIEEFRALLLKKDWDGLVSKAHTLAGASGNVSAKDVYSCCEQIEKAAKKGHVDASDIDALEHALQIACHSMNEILK
ncbi:response regulator [Halodesulfovibrio sp.]|jgi:signal transduction histidine kinase/DNA-binding response OmpR family regulator|uniref:response regulator n=1 Tax=Halodesulfovibrio sp. TaxID=1912772 RepID=UPI0025F71E48|nr:response regulator [Halodesulfovibrio sp.]MCT4628061.1 response regulator [Halodesulfovibrio sp.]